MEHAVQHIDEEQYIVRNPKEVMQILNDLIKQKSSIRVSFNHGADVALTTVIGIDIRTHVVHLDIGRDEEFNRRLFASNHVLFFKEDGVKIKWSSAHVSEVSLKDGKAIKIALPKDMVRLQRRDFFRYATPIASPVLCRIPVPDEANPGEEKELEFTLLDVSLGGVGMITTDELHPAFEAGVRFNSCKISFPDVGVTNLTLEVRSVTKIQVKEGVFKYRLGMKFIEPSRGNEGLINRYVFILERLAIALAHGSA